jgi:Protein of unknown function (DUF1501)
MNPLLENRLLQTRRQFLGRSAAGIGLAALGSLLQEASASVGAAIGSPGGPSPDVPHFLPRAKRVIYLFQSGAPSQLDLFDDKPKLRALQATELPGSVRMGQRLTAMTATQDRFPIAPSHFKFSQHGDSGAWLSELLPYTARVVDADGSDQPRPGDHVFPDRRAVGGPAEHRGMACLRTGEREHGPARVCGFGLQWQWQSERSTAL